METGIIRQLPSGEFTEEHRPLTEEELAPLLAKDVPALEAGPQDGVPAPRTRGLAGKARSIANRAFAETVPLPPNGNGHGNGNGNGHKSGEHPAVEAGRRRDAD